MELPETEKQTGRTGPSPQGELYPISDAQDALMGEESLSGHVKYTVPAMRTLPHGSAVFYIEHVP